MTTLGVVAFERGASEHVQHARQQRVEKGAGVLGERGHQVRRRAQEPHAHRRPHTCQGRPVHPVEELAVRAPKYTPPVLSPRRPLGRLERGTQRLENLPEERRQLARVQAGEEEASQF